MSLREAWADNSEDWIRWARAPGDDSCWRFCVLRSRWVRRCRAVDKEMTNWLAGQVSDLQLERISGADGAALVDPLFREYGLWVADQLLAHHGLRFSEADLERHHTAFRGELPGLVGPRGRLLLARIGDEPVGVGTLKPVDGATGEIKRMYVRPAARGRGVGRALLERLVADARADGYVVVRLETLDFMKEAHTLYRSLGFIGTTVFEGSEAVAAGIDSHTHYLELRLPTAVGTG